VVTVPTGGSAAPVPIVKSGMTFRSAPIKSLGVVAAALMAAGCAAQQPGTAPTPSASVSAKPASPVPSGQQITVSGTVERDGVEGGCTVLRATSGPVYELAGGDPALLRPGAQVTVTGLLRPDVATICQLGPVLQVVTVKAA
jgi:hypothetical protein